MTTDLERMMMEDSIPELPNTYELSDIADLAAHQKELTELIEIEETKLSELKKRYRHVSESALPAAMQSVGMTSFIMKDGSKVSIKVDVFASIRADFIPQAIEWLDEHHLGGIVKDEIRINLGPGEIEKAQQIMLFADEQGVSADEKKFVHPGTLKATIKEMRKKGVEFPDEFFSIHDVAKAIIK
jgi:hypothetical protein